MPEIHDTYGRVRQNLIDAGCDKTTTEECMACFKEGNEKKLLLELARHRRSLLDELHKEQKRIDCLDYLVYSIQKEGKQKEAKK